MASINYTPSKTVKAFMRDDTFFRIIRGPYGSGKTTGCVMEALRRSIEIPAMQDGMKRSRWAFVRNTRQQLKDTLLKSVLELLPSELGTWKESDFTYNLRFDNVHSEWMFRSLDTPDDIRRLLSLQLTGIFIEECREIPLSLVIEAQTRLRRFPRIQDVPHYWSGMICATNPPEIDSDWYKVMEGKPLIDDEPDTVVPCALFVQPSALSPEAENLEFLHEKYYTDMMKGKSQEWIDTNIHNKYSMSSAGKPVYRGAFKYDRHVSTKPLKIDPHLPVIVGQDTARSPASVFMQLGYDGRLRILREATGFDMGTKTFDDMKIRPLVRNFFGAHPLVFVMDPAGLRGNETDDNSWFLELRKRYPRDEGHAVETAETNDPIARINALDAQLRSWPDGEPSVLIDPSCTMLIDGLRSKYRYARLRGSDGKYHDRPEKNNWSHVVEAAQYGAMFISGKHYDPTSYGKSRKSRNVMVAPRAADRYAGY